MISIGDDAIAQMARGDKSEHSEVLAKFYPPKLALTGYQELMAAILRDAISLCDLKWINSKQTEYVFSFVNACENLGLDPSATRKVLNQELKDKKPKETASQSSQQSHKQRAMAKGLQKCPGSSRTQKLSAIERPF